MRALLTLAIFVAPFVIIGLVTKILMKRKAVDLADVQAAAGPKARPRKAFLLGACKEE